MHSRHDVPKSLGDEQVRKERLSRLQKSHIRRLTLFVEGMRQETGFGDRIPYFDPDDGGTEARCLFLLEAPGPKAVQSGFISRNNPDESAKNFSQVNAAAGIPREMTVTWNIVPWYIGSGKRIRAATRKDIDAGLPYLARLLPLLPKLKVVALVGRKAQVAEEFVHLRVPWAEIVHVFHPSPMFVNNKPENRGRIVEQLQQVARVLGVDGSEA